MINPAHPLQTLRLFGLYHITTVIDWMEVMDLSTNVGELHSELYWKHKWRPFALKVQVAPYETSWLLRWGTAFTLATLFLYFTLPNCTTARLVVSNYLQTYVKNYSNFSNLQTTKAITKKFLVHCPLWIWFPPPRAGNLQEPLLSSQGIHIFH